MARSLLPQAWLERAIQLLPSSRPRLAMMPRGVATRFTDLLLFTVSVLDHLGIKSIIHYGTLLGAARLGTPLPWDEDHDLFVYDVTREEIETRVRPILEAHHYATVWDERGFLWVRERHWKAGSGHLGLAFLPPLVDRVEDLPVWKGGAPHLAVGELEPRIVLPLAGSHVHGPAATERLLSRLYGESASVAVMARFKPTPIEAETRAFWQAARTPERLDWAAISARFQARSRWRHLVGLPWWWFNGGYIIGINKLKRWAAARLAASRSGSDLST